MRSILTFDVGTTAIKTCMFDETLAIMAVCTDEYDLLGESGVVELDSETYWQTICRAVASIGQNAPLDTVVAICLTTQGETMIPVDANGNALHRAVVWLDDRAKVQAAEILRKKSQAEIYRLTGVTDMNGFVPLAKMLWFRQERPEIYEQTHRFLLLEDYLLYRLTGRFVTEKSILTSTAYFDIRNDCYWTELLKALDLDVKKLPEILDCGQLAGMLQPEAMQSLGLPDGVQVFAGAMDQIAAAIGGGGMRPGVVTATVGTAMVLTSSVADMEDCTVPSLILYRGITERQYAILPLCPTAGAVVKWFKDQCCALEVQQCRENGADIYDVLCNMAAEISPGAEGVTLLPYLAGSLQPHCLADAKGVFFGIGLTTDRRVMTRAVLESIGYMLRENLELLRQFGIHPTAIHFFGGGSKNPIWNQIIADIAGVELVLLEQGECGSIGAAMLGAVSLGWYADVEAAQRCNHVRQVIVPDKTKREAYHVAYSRYQKILKTIAPLFEG